MKDDSKQKKEKLENIKDELSKKVEAIMGPPPDAEVNAPTEKKTKKKDKDEAEKPKTEPEKPAVIPSAPLVAGETFEPKEPVLPVDIEKTEPAEEKPEPEAPEAEEKPEEDIDAAVDDIAAKESDELLEKEDEEIKKAFEPENTKKRNIFSRWWHNKTARWATIILLLLAVAGVATVPTTRYYLLNFAGVRSSASLRVLDESTQQPLKNVEVTLAGASGTTNDEGVVTLSQLELGDTQLIVKRRAFADTTKNVTIGWGSNPLGDVNISPTGLQYSFVVTDFLSGKPIEKAEAYSGEASAFSDKDGKVLLTIDKTGDEAVEIKIRADSYREETVVDKGTEATQESVKMVPAQKQVFVSKRSGKYDVYKIDADGKNEKLVFSGTGFERNDMVLASHPTDNVTALVSTRDNSRSADGFLLSTLRIINVDDSNVTSVDTAERIQVVGWIGDDLIYVQASSSDATPDSAETQKLMSYDYVSQEKIEIAVSDYFNDVVVAGDKVFYAPSAIEEKDKPNAKLYVTNSDGSGRQTLLDKETWRIFRNGYDTLVLSVEDEWYDYKLGAQSPTKLNGAPASQQGRIYINGTDSSKSLWVDDRDGKGVLLSYDVSSAKDTALVSKSGLTYPVRWLNATTAVFRIHTDQETADYVVSTRGGEPKKITDVTNTTGIDNWYYY